MDGMNRTALSTLCLVFLALGSLTATAPAASQSAREAKRALPGRFQDHVVKISADEGTPDPPKWFFVCRAAHGEDGILSLVVQNGRLLSTKPSLDLRVALGNYSRINFDRVLVDSRGTYEIAQRYIKNAKPGKTLGAVSYLLQQAGEDADPIWSLWCYDSSGRYLGLLKVLASTGDVILWE